MMTLDRITRIVCVIAVLSSAVASYMAWQDRDGWFIVFAIANVVILGYLIEHDLGWFKWLEPTEDAPDDIDDFPKGDRFSGMWICAPQGQGKTTLLRYLFQQDIKRKASIIVFDSKPEFSKEIRNLAAIKDRVILIDADHDPPFALNPLDLKASKRDDRAVHRATQLITDMFNVFGVPLSETQETFVHNLLYALITVVPHSTLTTLLKWVDQPEAWKEHQKQIATIRRERIKDYFLSGQVEKVSQETRGAVSWRISKILDDPTLEKMFSAPETKIDMEDFMDNGNVVIINTSIEDLGGPVASEFFGRFFLSLVLAAAYKRASRLDADKLPCYLYLDEAQTLIFREPKLESIIHQLRSQKIAVIVAHHSTTQIQDARVKQALQDCAIRLANTNREAEIMEAQMAPPPEDEPDPQAIKKRKRDIAELEQDIEELRIRYIEEGLSVSHVNAKIAASNLAKEYALLKGEPIPLKKAPQQPTYSRDDPGVFVGIIRGVNKGKARYYKIPYLNPANFQKTTRDERDEIRQAMLVYTYEPSSRETQPQQPEPKQHRPNPPRKRSKSGDDYTQPTKWKG